MRNGGEGGRGGGSSGGGIVGDGGGVGRAECLALGGFDFYKIRTSRSTHLYVKCSVIVCWCRASGCMLLEVKKSRFSVQIRVRASLNRCNSFGQQNQNKIPLIKGKTLFCLFFNSRYAIKKVD